MIHTMLLLWERNRKSVKATLQKLLTFKAKSGRELAPTTQMNMTSALRSGLSLISAKYKASDFLPTTRYIAKRLNSWVRRQAAPMSITEVHTMLRLPGTSPKLRARVALTWCLGLRVSDVKHLRKNDVLTCSKTQGLLLRLRGAKGARPGTESYYRACPLTGQIAHHVYVYLRSVDRKSDAPLFAGSSFDQVRRLIKRVNKNLSCHSIRRGAATHLALEGRSTEFIRQFLGHAHLSTTRLYIQPDLRMKDYRRKLRLLRNLCA